MTSDAVVADRSLRTSARPDTIVATPRSPIAYQLHAICMLILFVSPMVRRGVRCQAMDLTGQADDDALAGLATPCEVSGSSVVG